MTYFWAAPNVCALHPLSCMQDADSLDPAEGKKSEGAFYVWTSAEVAEALGGDPLKVAAFGQAYRVKEDGEWLT